MTYIHLKCFFLGLISTNSSTERHHNDTMTTTSSTNSLGTAGVVGAGVRMWEQRVGGGPSQPGGGGGLGAALFDKQEVAAMNSSGSASGQIKTLYSSIRKKLILLYYF